MTPKAADGETRTSRVIGSFDFVRPIVPESSSEGDNALTVVTGIRCCMPFTIKCLPNTYGDDVEARTAIEKIANQVFTIVEEKLSNYNPNSEVNFVNQLPIDTPHTISEPLKEVLICSKELMKLTRGAFDPAASPLLKHYAQLANLTQSSDNDVLEDLENKDVDMATKRRQKAVLQHIRGLVYRGFAEHPSDNRVSKRVQHLIQVSQWANAFSVGIQEDTKWKSFGVQKLEDLEKQKVYQIRKKHTDARLDLNAIAKGWAIDKIANLLPSPCYVEWGGDIKVRGIHPSGRLWTVAVPEPPNLSKIRQMVDRAKQSGQKGPVYNLATEYSKDKESSGVDYLAVLDLRDGDAVATSGDFENVIERDGKLYNHIINPKVGHLLELNDETLAQAVVVSNSCMVADALATAAISKEDPAQARAMLDPFRTGYRKPLSDYLLYARYGPRIIRLSVPGVDPKALKAKRLQRHNPAKVIVVGSGLAGMAAAIEAAEARASVILLEKEPKTGGNSAKATSGMNGWGTDTQATQGVADEERLFERDTFRSGIGGSSNPSLVRTLSTKSAPAIHWLKYKFGIPLDELSQCGGHSRKRTHRAPPDDKGNPVPIGWLIMNTLKNAIEFQYQENIEVRCGQTVSRLLHEVDENGVKTVVGVEVNGKELKADAVILCTGGFGCSRDQGGVMARFRPDLVGNPTTNGSFAQGDGVKLGEEVGAELIDMDKVQLHPTGFINPKDPSNPTKILAPEAIRGCGGILVNSKGQRFVNELDLRSVVAAAIQKQCSPYQSDNYTGPPFAWCILGREAQEMFGKKSLGFYKDKLGLFEYCEDVDAVASIIGCPMEALAETLEAYDEAIAMGTCLQTGKDIFPSRLSKESKGMIVARVTPSIHYTMGGLNINPSGEVQECIKDSTVGTHRRIRRLFAAGEVTGGVHGGNRLAGNSLLECVVYGRLAGQRAATVNMPDQVMFPEAALDDGHCESRWRPMMVREVRNTDEQYGINTREVRFNLHGPLQHSGLDVGQFIGIRGEKDGETLLGYFSPITRPNDEGVIGILCRVDDKGGPITNLLDAARPGSILHMCAMGGLRLKFDPERIHFRGQTIRRIGLLAGGTGIAPMLQIIRAYGKYVREHSGYVEPGGLNLIYAAEAVGDLAYMKILEEVREQIPNHFRFYVVLNRPPLGWTEGVGFVEKQDIMKRMMYPPQDGDLAVMCGPPIFEWAMRKTLSSLGFKRSQWFSFSEDDKVSTDN